MITFEVPASHSTRMVLVAEPRRERGEVSIVEPTSWIDLNDPVSLTLQQQPVHEDKELERFLAADDRRYRYDYVKLGCTFGPQGSERFEKAWMKVDLKAVGESPLEEQPICWSLFPLNEYDQVEETLSTKIGSSAKVLSAEIGASSKVTRRLYSIRGFREGGSKPFWEMYGTEAASLNGVFRFHMVVRSPADAHTMGEVRLEAVISNRSFFVFREKRPYNDLPVQEFHLKPI
jgi:hypothetical protein